MDIAKLGVAIDPQKAIEGAKKTKDALKEIGEAAKTELKKVDESANKAGESTKKMADTGRKGMAEFGQGIVSLMDGLGLMDNGFGNLVRRSMSMYQAMQQARAMLAAVEGAGAATATGLAAAASGASGAATAMTANAAATTANAAASTAAATASNFLATAEAAKAAATAQATSATTAGAVATTAAAAANTAAATASATATAAAATASTALATSSAAAAAGLTAMGASAGRSVPPMVTLMAIMRALQAMMDGVNTKALGYKGFGKTIDIDAQVVGNVSKLDTGMKLLGNSSNTTALALPRVAAGASSAGAASAGAAAAVSSMGVVVAGLTVALLALVAAFTAVGVAIAAFKAGLPMASFLEDAETGLAVLMGSWEKAGAKLQEMNQFAAKTPFDSRQLLTGVRYLEIFTQGLMNNEKGWRLVGDAASASGQQFDAVAMWVGRMYAALKGGQPIGEATMRLMEMGLITPEVKAGLDSMAESGNKGGQNFAKIWGVAEQSLQRFNGTMALAEGNWSSKMNAMSEGWEMMLAAFASPIKDSLKPVLDDLIQLLTTMQPIAAALGQAIADGISILYQAFSDGQLTRLIAVTFMAGLETVADGWASLMWGTIVWLGESLGNTLGEAADKAANAFIRAFYAFVNWLAEQINKILTPLTANAAALGLGSVSIIGPIGAPKPVNYFEPGRQRSLSETIAAQQGQLVGTGWRDEAAKISGDLLLKAREGQKKGELPEAAKPGTMPPPKDKGSGGKEDIPKAKEVELLDTQVQKPIKDWTDLKKQMDQGIADIGRSIADNMTGGIMDVVNGTKDLKTAFGDMAMAIINDIVRMVIQMYVQLAVAQMLAAFGYGGSGGAGYSVGGKVVSAHTGGVAGSRKLISSGGMGTFHTGGITTAEAMVKVERGETILTRKRAEELENQLSSRQSGGKKDKGGTGVTILNVTDASQVLDVIASNPDAIVNAISRRQPAVRSIVSSKERK